MKIRRVGNHQQVSLPGKSTGGGKGGRSGSWGGTARRPSKPEEPATPALPAAPARFFLRQASNTVVKLVDLPAVSVNDTGWTINTPLSEVYLLHYTLEPYDGTVQEGASGLVSVSYQGAPVSQFDLSAHKGIIIRYDATSLGGSNLAYASYTTDTTLTKAEIDDSIANFDSQFEQLNLAHDPPMWGYIFALNSTHAVGNYTFTYTP